MKQTKAVFSLLVGITFLFLVVPLVSAVGSFDSAEVETGSSSRKSPEWRRKLEAKKQAIRERRTERQQIIIEKVAAKLTAVVDRLDSKVEKMNGFIDRLYVRADKLAGRGVDVSTAQTSLDSARQTLNTAQNAITELSGKISILEASETPREAVESFRTEMKLIRDQFHQVRRHLVDTVHALRGAINTNRPSPLEESE